MKINFSRIFLGYWKSILRSAALAELDRISGIIAEGDSVTLATAKKRICRVIQSKHHVPGELRRILENLVNDVQADDILMWLIRVRAIITASEYL